MEEQRIGLAERIDKLRLAGKDKEAARLAGDEIGNCETARDAYFVYLALADRGGCNEMLFEVCVDIARDKDGFNDLLYAEFLAGYANAIAQYSRRPDTRKAFGLLNEARSLCLNDPGYYAMVVGTEAKVFFYANPEKFRSINIKHACELFEKADNGFREAGEGFAQWRESNRKHWLLCQKRVPLFVIKLHRLIRPILGHR